MHTWQRLKQDPELFKQYFVREQVIDKIRKFFKDQKFHEVQTPILVPIPSAESNLEVFQTELCTSTGHKQSAYLITSPEYAIKKLLSAGVGSCFEITRSFRNEEEVTSAHNPEFTILEWYRVNANYEAVMQDCEQLLIQILSTNLTYQGQSYDLRPPWTRISVAQAFEKFCGIDTDSMLDETKLLTIAKARGYKVADETTWEQVFYQFFFNEIEPQIKAMDRPVFIYDYPVSQASLSKKKVDDPRFAERFELFLAGLELGNCFSELDDADEQQVRLQKDLDDRKKNNKTEYPMDDQLIEALRLGLPEVSGIAMGVDRLIMLASDVPSIADTLFFPGVEM